MQNTPQSGIQCGDICNGPTISGLSGVCTNSTSTSTYNVINIPTAATVTWSVSPANIVSMSTNGNAATLTMLVNGATVILTATITNGCPGQPSVVS